MEDDVRLALFGRREVVCRLLEVVVGRLLVVAGRL